jgi:hypothetical protein
MSVTSDEPKQKSWTQVDSRAYNLLLKIASAASLYCEKSLTIRHTNTSWAARETLDKALDEFDAL